MSTAGAFGDDVYLPVLQPRKSDFGETRQEAWNRSTPLQSLRAAVPDRHKLYALAHPTPIARLGLRFKCNDVAIQTDLSAAVDVYSDWIDACEAVAREGAEADEEDRRFSTYGTQRATAAAARGGGEGEDEDGAYDEDI